MEQYIPFSRNDRNLLEELNRKLDLLLSSARGPATNSKKWLSEKEAQELTGKKTTTLYKLRQQGLITYTKINKKTFYLYDSIIGLMDSNMVNKNLKRHG